MKSNKLLNYIILYVVLAFISFGWSWNHYEIEWYTCEAPYRRVFDLEGHEGKECFYPQDKAIRAVVDGFFWPIIMTAKLSIAITKWP